MNTVPVKHNPRCCRFCRPCAPAHPNGALKINTSATGTCHLVSVCPLNRTPLPPLAANNAVCAAKALCHTKAGKTVIYTGGDYRNARQLLTTVKKRATEPSRLAQKCWKKDGQKERDRRKLTESPPIPGCNGWNGRKYNRKGPTLPGRYWFK